jgi:hypothetical protein
VGEGSRMAVRVRELEEVIRIMEKKYNIAKRRLAAGPYRGSMGTGASTRRRERDPFHTVLAEAGSAIETLEHSPDRYMLEGGPSIASAGKPRAEMPDQTTETRDNRPTRLVLSDDLPSGPGSASQSPAKPRKAVV